MATSCGSQEEPVNYIYIYVCICIYVCVCVSVLTLENLVYKSILNNSKSMQVFCK